MNPGNILVADDDSAIRTVLSQALSRAGYDVRTTGTAATLWGWVKAGDGDLVITDVVMPDENAFELLPRIKKLRPELPIIVMSAQNTFMTAIKASERGAYDYLPKPFDLRELVSIVGRAMAEPKKPRIKASLPEDLDNMPLVGRSPAMQEIYRSLARLMATDLTVMITGESGTGKELVARALHDYGKRKKGPVRRHQHGGDPARPHRERAVRSREGRLHRRQPALVPAGLSRPRAERCSSTRSATCRWRRRRGCCACLQQGEYTTVGGRTADQDQRAHHRRHQQGPADPDRAGAVSRRSVLPPERRAAAAAALARAHRGRCRLLAQHFFKQAAAEGLPSKQLEPGALERMKRYRWPGNIRELENLIRRLAALYPQESIGEHLVDLELSADSVGFMPAPPDVPVQANSTLSASTARRCRWRPPSSGIFSKLFSSHGDNLPPPGLYHRILQARSRCRCMTAALAATRGNQIKRGRPAGPQPQHAAQEDPRPRHKADAIAALNFAGAVWTQKVNLSIVEPSKLARRG